MTHFRWPMVTAVASVLMWWLPLFGAHAAEEDYVIGAADVLEVLVWDNKDLNQVVSVRPDGKISLPLIGEVRAEGRTVQQLQGELRELYKETVKEAIPTVLVKEIKSRPVYFIGGFTKPGVEQLTRPLTLLQAVSIAGGLVLTADGDNGFVVRGDRRIPIDFTRLLQKGDMSQNIQLEPGDSVVVPVADSVYVQGEVKTPGAVKWVSDLTVLRALSLTGGITPLGNSGRVEILRGHGENKQRMRIDVGKVMKDPTGNPDVLLKPNDIIFVPQRLF
jgi:polysaccharide export outer membrane protein